VILASEPAPVAGDWISLPDMLALATTVRSEHLDLRQIEVSADFLSDIVYTSGTTGQPKGAMLTHGMVLRAAYSSALTRSFEDGRRIQFALPMYHVFGYVECWVASMIVGGAIVPHVRFDPAEMLEWCARLQTTDVVCVPVMTRALIDTARQIGFEAPALLAVFNSGGVNSPSIWHEIRTILGAPEIHTAYGMTETTASAVCTLTEDVDERLIGTNGRLKLAGVAGDPAIGGLVAQYRVVDVHSGAILSAGQDGELQVRGPIVTKGYFQKPEEDAQAFTRDGWFRTGDLGCLTADGYLRLTGRIKESYRCGGEMVMPKEVEDLFEGYPGASQVLAVGVPDARMGEVGCLCVVTQEGADIDGAAMRDFCAKRLAKFKVPRHVLVLDQCDIPVTATGRPQKFKLSQLAARRLGLTQPD
jgi:fatty-acyl-CoA synthase